MTDEKRYETIDIPFYRREIAPFLPLRILDAHTHTWSADNWREIPWHSDKAGGTYMVTDEQYPPEILLGDGSRCFPDREYHAVCFGYPTPAVDWEKDTAYVAAAARKHPQLHPLVLAGSDLKLSREQYEHALANGGFYGFKIFLNWYGDNYGNKRVEEMMGPTEIALANERQLFVTLHVPGAGRLADPQVQRGVQWIARECPEASIILAHCGRCYMPAEMKTAIGSIRTLPNVVMDTSMVMDPVTIQLALHEIGPSRLLFGTDFPPAHMRGRRVRVMDHWVDVVLPGYPESANRIRGDIRATFMPWEMILAIRWATELTGISRAETDAIFWDNGWRLLKRVSREMP